MSSIRRTAAFMTLAVVACQEPTQLTVKLTTNLGCDTWQQVGLVATSDESVTRAPIEAVTKTCRAAGLIGSVVVRPEGDSKGNVYLRVTLGIDRDAAACVENPIEMGCITQWRKLTFLRGERLTVPIALNRSCRGVVCDGGFTCSRAGTCIPAAIDARYCRGPEGCALEPDGPDPMEPEVVDPTPDAGADAREEVESPDVPNFAVAPAATCARRRGKKGMTCWGYLGSEGGGIGQGAASAGPIDFGFGRAVERISPMTFVVNQYPYFQASACAVLSDRTATCWGNNSVGELGEGSTTPRGPGPFTLGTATPELNLGRGRFARNVSGSTGHSCAVLDDGSVKCWGGNNAFGQLGYGDMSDRGSLPGQMGNSLPALELGTGKKAIDVAVAEDHACALFDDHTVKCWGGTRNGGLGYGVLGYGDTFARGDGSGEMGDRLPVIDVGSRRTVRAISVAEGYSCAILDNGRVKCWGNVPPGVILGDEPDEMGDYLPYIELGTGRTVHQIVASRQRACAVLDDGNVKCWGRTSVTQDLEDPSSLGYGDTLTRGVGAASMGDNLPPVNFGTGRRVLALSPGSASHMCAWLDNATLKCWGDNMRGQLGYADTKSRGNAPGEMGDALPAVSF